jgi:ribosomal protein S18 acetylase RimI-like enzyme
MNLQIRRATDGDYAYIADLGKRTVMDSVARLRHPDVRAVEESYERLLHIVDEREHVALIALDDRQRVGFAMFLSALPDEVTGEEQAFLVYMAVERERRGGGIGSALLAAAETHARERGAPYMALMVTEENAAALALYERAGYLTERRLMCKVL